jgi:hypothetical protein
MSLEHNDGALIYCPRLGHSLSFTYCREEHEGKPCARIVTCWHNLFPVEHWLARHFTKEEIQYIDEPPTAKLSSIVEMIEKAKKTRSTL